MRFSYRVFATLNLFNSGLFAKQCILVLGKCGEKHHSEDSAGNDLSGAYSKHHKRDWKVGAISVCLLYTSDAADD